MLALAFLLCAVGQAPIGDEVRVPMSLTASVAMFAWGRNTTELADALDRSVVREPRPGVIGYRMPRMT